MLSGISGASTVTLMDREPVALACSMLSAVASGITISEDLPPVPAAAGGSAAGKHHRKSSSIDDTSKNSGSGSPDGSRSNSIDSGSSGISGTSNGSSQREGPSNDPSLSQRLWSGPAGELHGSGSREGDTWPLAGSSADAVLRELLAELQSLGISVPSRWEAPHRLASL